MIVLPFPSSKLSGHDKRVNWARARIVKDHRDWAFTATLAAKPLVPADGDIRLHIHFVPPDRRGDRCNFWNRCKPYIDGIAEALGVNDSRFLPSKSFASPEKPGRVEVSIATDRDRFGDNFSHIGTPGALNKNDPDASANSSSGPDHNASEVRDDC